MNLSPEKIIFIIAVILVSVFTLLFIYKKLPKKLRHNKFYDSWKKIQKMCGDKDDWKQAIVMADDLLDKALKKKNYKGTSMGERLVEAQKVFSNNDAVWYSHKLRKKIDADSSLKLSKDDTKKALLGIGQALKDLGAIR